MVGGLSLNDIQTGIRMESYEALIGTTILQSCAL